MSGRIRIGRNVAVALLAAMLVAGCGGRPDTPESLLASAKEHLGKGDRKAAVIQLRSALKKNPSLAEARFLLGTSLLENNDLPGAEKELHRAVQLQYPADEIVPALARLQLRLGDYRSVLDEFGSATIVAPAQRADLQTTIGDANMALGNTQAARAAFAAALVAQPGYPRALVGEARLKAVEGDIPGALALVETALATSPALTDVWHLKGQLLVAQKQIEPAVAAYRSALESKADDVAAHYEIVVLLLQAGKTEDARAQFAAMQKAAPKHPQTLYLQALLAFGEKDYAGARDAIQLQLKAAPGNVAGLLLGAQIDFRLGSFAPARAALGAILQAVPRHAFARWLLVRTYLREGRPGDAVEALQPLLQGAPKNSDILALAGEVYAQNGDLKAAAHYFEQATALDPRATDKRTAAAIVQIVKGESARGLRELDSAAAEDTGILADLALVAAHFRQRKLDAALAAVDAIEKKQPDKPLPHNLRGQVLLAKRDVAGARRSFERALAVDPVYFPAVAELARLALAEKKPEDAKARFDAVVAKDPQNTQALLALASLRAQAGGSSDEVAALIGKAVTANPTEPAPRLSLITHYLRTHEPTKAVAAAQDAVAAFPDRPEVLDAAGQAHRAAGDTNQAIKTYHRLYQLRPDLTLPLMRIAEMQIADKEYDAASETLRKVVVISPDLTEARRALIALDLADGRTGAALTAARDLQRQRPTEAAGYLLEGNIHASKKAWNDAANAYRAGLKRAATTDLAIYLHSALDAGGKGPEANAFAASWLRDHPKDRIFRHQLAQLALGKKEYASAAKQYKALLEIERDDALALNNLAWVAGQLKDPQAIEYAERADKLSPGNPMILDTYGMLLLENGETKRGVGMLQQAAGLAPNAAGIRLNLARALLKDGQKDAAKKELDALAKLGDGYSRQAEVAKLIQGL